MSLIDHYINDVGDGVNEVLILMNYCKGSVLTAMNDRLKDPSKDMARGVFEESEILRIFCDVCEAVSCLHHNKPSVIHRDLKVSFDTF